MRELCYIILYLDDPQKERNVISYGNEHFGIFWRYGL